MPLVFYVDDSRDDLFYADYISKKQRTNIDLQCFPDTRSALRALEDLQAAAGTLPDALVVDLYMPLDSGLELISQLRADQRFSGIRLGVCTGSDAVEDRERAMAAGADFYTGKPIDLGAIVNGAQ
ncbi:hypothetical protein A6U87_01515 [Rhizobium sp. AC44/96]|jgi:CheY-like chemotaxis protein|uniref:response regulator n=1 Tax=Rhizobium sp. AC44/96 TaxID=1841654 RepID=UPI00080FD836|nr:response regulator [Rhizobium sp. AC44/96]OCJ17642.1 hypothetical protein A6U87_01515 [Rhizobium sp. AC44/96]